MFLTTTTDDSGFEVFVEEFDRRADAISAARDTLIVTGYSATVEDLSTGDVVWSATAEES